MKYKNAYKLNVQKLKQYIKVSKKTKLQISNDALTTDRTLRRALNGESINLITIQNLAKLFKTQINHIIKDNSFDMDSPPVFFEKITDVRQTLNDIYLKHGNNWNDGSGYFPNIYYHYDLRLNDNITEKINFLSILLKSDHRVKRKKINFNPELNEYLEKQNYSLKNISKGNTCLDELEKDANVYIGHYTFMSIEEFPYSQSIDAEGYYLSPYSKVMSLIVFSEKKFEKLILYPNVGYSGKKLNEIYSKIIENKDRKANIKECKLYLKDFIDDEEDAYMSRGAFLEANKYFPSCLNERRQDSYELNFPSFNINVDRYRGDIIPVEDSNTNKKEAAMK